MMVSVDENISLFINAYTRQELQQCKLHPLYFGDYVLPHQSFMLTSLRN
jgi:hypothetical protein